MTRASMTETVLAIPVKDLTSAKQRLVPVLTPAERAALARAMLRDVLRAASGAGFGAVWLITRDPEAAALAGELGIPVVRETENRGHTSAVAVAQARAVAEGALAFLTVPGDVPCVTAPELVALARAAHEAAPVAAFAASRSGLGTNGAALAPPGLMPLTFGEPSFENHLAAARRLGLVPRRLFLPGLALDIDAADDLAALLADGPATESGRLVASWDMAARLRLPRAAAR
jgi:2-phospho-L-lactate guanylyltransferase